VDFFRARRAFYIRLEYMGIAKQLGICRSSVYVILKEEEDTMVEIVD